MKKVVKQTTKRCKTFKEWEKEAWSLLEQSMFACSAKDLYKAIPLPIGYAPKHVSAWLKQKYKDGQLSMLQPVPKEAHKYIIPKENKGLKGIHVKSDKKESQATVIAHKEEIKAVKPTKSQKQKQTETDVCNDILHILDDLITAIQDLKQQIKVIKADI